MPYEFVNTEKGFHSEQESPNEAELSPNEAMFKYHNPRLGRTRVSDRQAMQGKMDGTHFSNAKAKIQEGAPPRAQISVVLLVAKIVKCGPHPFYLCSRSPGHMRRPVASEGLLWDQRILGKNCLLFKDKA